MGCIPSKSSLDVQPKPEMSTTARATTRGSSVEIFSGPPHSPSSIETKVSPEQGAPIPPRVDCIAPRPKPSEESLRRRRADDDQAHHEGGTSAVASVGGGAVVQAENGATGTGGGDAGGDGSGGDGGGGGGE